MTNPAQTILIWLHVVANIFWIGSIAAVALIAMAEKHEAKTRGEIALTVYRKVANPAFIASFLLGAGRLFMDTGYYFKQTHFMHGKLLFAFIVIGLHHVIGARARKLATGDSEKAGNLGVLLAILAIAAAAATFFVVAKIPR